MDDPSIEPTAPTVLLHTEEVRSRHHEDEEEQEQSSPTQLNETLHQQQHEEANPPSPTLPAGAFTLKSPERVPVYSDHGQTPPPSSCEDHEQKNENIVVSEGEQPRRVSVSFVEESNQEKNEEKVEEIQNEQQQQASDPPCEIPPLNIVDDQSKPPSKKKTSKKSATPVVVDALPVKQEKDEDTLLRDLTKLGLQNYYKHFCELLLPREANNNDNQQQQKGTDDANEKVNDQKSQLSAPDPGDTPRAQHVSASATTQQQQENAGEGTNENQKHENSRKKVTCLAHLGEIPASHWEMYVPVKKHRDTIRAYLHSVNFSGTSWKSADSKRINPVNVRRQTAVSNVMQTLGHLDTLVDKKLGLQKSFHNKVQSNFSKNQQRLDPRRSHNTLGVEGETEGMNADESTVVKSRIKKVVQELDEAKAKLQEAMGGLNQKNNISDNKKSSASKNESENNNNKKKTSIHNTSSAKKQKQNQNDDNDDNDDDEIIYKTPFPRQAFVCRPTSDKPRFGPFSRAAAAIQIQREEQNRIHVMIRKHQQEEKEKQRESFMQAMMNSLDENGGSFVLPDGSRVVRVANFENLQGTNTNNNHENSKEESNIANQPPNEANSTLPSDEKNVNPGDNHDSKPKLATATIPTTDLPFSPTPPTSTPTPKKLNQQRPQSATNNNKNSFSSSSSAAAFASGHAFAYAKFSVFKADFEHAERAPTISSASAGINNDVDSTPGTTNQTKNSRPNSAAKTPQKMSSFQYKMVPGNSSTKKRQTRSPEKTTPRSENNTTTSHNTSNHHNNSSQKPSSTTPIPLHHNYHSKPHPLQDHDLFLGSGNYPNCNDEIFAQTHPNYTFPRNTCSSNLHISPEGAAAATGGSRSRSGSRSPSPNKNLGGHFHDPDVEALIIRSKEIELQKLKSKAASANPFYRKYFQQRQEKSSSSKKKIQEHPQNNSNNNNTMNGFSATASGNNAFSQYYFSTHAHQSKPASTKTMQHNYAASSQHQYPPRPMSAADAQSMPIPPASPRSNNPSTPQFVSPPPPNIKTGYRSPSPAFWGCTTENDETLNTQRGFVLRGVGSARR